MTDQKSACHSAMWLENFDAKDRVALLAFASHHQTL